MELRSAVITPTIAVPVSNHFPWFAIRTRAKHEKVAATILANKGFEQYVPMYRKRRRWSDRVVESDQPLFPGYFFCRFDPKKRLPILTTPNVVSIVGFASEPAPVPDEEIEAVQAILRSGLTAEPCSYLREGQPIRVRCGALEGLEGLLVKKKSEWRMVVSVTMLHRSLSVEIDREWIAPL